MVPIWRVCTTFFGWMAIGATIAFLFSGAAAFAAQEPSRQVEATPGAVDSVPHEHEDYTSTDKCHPGMACSFAALCVPHDKATLTQIACDVERLAVTVIMDRFTPEFDPPPPRRAR